MALALIASSLHAVLALVVPAQIHFTLEALGTNVTPERFEACMFPAVGDQVGALTERLTTHLALVGLFTYKIKHKQRKKTVRNLYNHISFLKKKIASIMKLPHSLEKIGFVSCAINGKSIFNQKVKSLH